MILARPAAAAAAEVRKFLAGMNEPDADWSRIPAMKPRIAGAFVDDAERLWVQRNSADATSLFDIYSAAGKPIATVRIPHTIIWWVRPAARGNIV